MPLIKQPMPRRGATLAGIAVLSGFVVTGSAAAQASARFHIRPDTALLDQQVAIRLTSARPGSFVTIRLTGANQASEATFIADRAGDIDLARDAPVMGTYATIDPMGLFWSTRRSAALPVANRPRGGGGDPRRAMPFQLVAESDGAVIATDTVWRRLVSPDVRITRMRDSGFTGTLYEPPGNQRRAAIVVLSGSGGGTPGPATSVGGLASRGYVVLALAGWADEGVPPHQAGIPLEYFERAIRWLRGRSSVDSNRVAALGGSKGGELALLLGATYPRLIQLVAAFVPSSVAWPGCCDVASRLAPGWTLGGRPVPHMPPDSALESRVNAESQHAALRQAPLYAYRLADTAAVARAAIPVERIAGPVLLVSARDDGVWASYQMAEQVMARLRRNRFSHPFQHLAYDGAGHMVARPYQPVPSVDAEVDSARGRRNDFGGVPAMTARAQQESWGALLAFLERHLAARSPSPSRAMGSAGTGGSAPDTLAAMAAARGASSDSAFREVQSRGAGVMGVDQNTSMHVFESLADGGRIILERPVASDTAGIRTIRAHMREIAGQFRRGDFSAPFLVHAQTVPGTAEMARLAATIAYVVVERPRGAEVRISTRDPAALKAVHEFLAFQRADHRAPGHEGHRDHRSPEQAGFPAGQRPSS